MATPGLQIVTPPAVEPVTLAEAKLWCRVDATDDDALITSLITAARDMAEKYTDRAFVTQTLRVSYDNFPLAHPSEINGQGGRYLPWIQVLESGGARSGIFRLPRAPLQSVASLTYTDPETGNVLTLDPTKYTPDATTEPGRVAAAWGTYWPCARLVPGSVKLTYVAGWGDTAASVPEAVKLAIKLAVATWYDNRSLVVTGTMASELPGPSKMLLSLYSIGEYA